MGRLISIVCTDRGQHAGRLLTQVYGKPAWKHYTGARLTRDASGAYKTPPFTPPSLIGDWEIDQPDEDRVAGWHYAAWEFRCPGCPPSRRLVNEDRLEALLDEARRQRRTSLDVSLMD